MDMLETGNYKQAAHANGKQELDFDGPKKDLIPIGNPGKSRKIPIRGLGVGSIIL